MSAQNKEALGKWDHTPFLKNILDDKVASPAVDTMWMNSKLVESLRRQLVEAIEENKKLRFMIENGLGYDDLKNDITYPTER